MKAIIIVALTLLISGCVNRSPINVQERALDELEEVLEETEGDLSELDDVSDELLEDEISFQSLSELDDVLDQLEDIFVLDEVKERELIP
jgi:hypothetical protein